ncbi:MAG: alanine racemase [Candidatus Omnitrophota bacterium]
MYRPLFIEVDLGALKRNARKVKNYLGADTGMIAVIKQAAYGHGLVPVAQALSDEGVDFFGVGSIEEAVELRNNGIKNSIFVLTTVLPEFADLFIEHNIVPTITDISFAKKLSKAAVKRNVKVSAHIKIDTGMGRLGAYSKDAYKFIDGVKRLDNLCLDGLYTHFPVADSDPEFTRKQIDIFNKVITQLKNDNIRFNYYHCANSAAIANYKDSHFNMARPGIILYGINPSVNKDLDVEPVLSLKSKVVFVKKIDKGMSVSYGRTFTADKSTYIATVAVGYADGYPLALSNNAKVIIKGEAFKLVGRVCMDHIMVDIGDRNDISIGDEVTLIGKEADSSVSAVDLADWAKTIPYEILSRLSLKIPRMYMIK